MFVWKRVFRLSLVVGLLLGLASPPQVRAQVSSLAEKAASVQAMRAAMPTQAQREAAAAELKAFKAKIQQARQQALKAGLSRPASAQLPPDVGPLGPNSFPDYYTTSNWAFSPPLKKFVDSLPGLGPSGASTRNLFIPVATPDTITYPGSDYYEISVREYDHSFHSELPATRLRGYVQTNQGTDGQGSNTVTPAAISYLGPIIVSQRNRPVRIKFTNQLPVGQGGDLQVPVDTTIMGAGKGPLWPASAVGTVDPLTGQTITTTSVCDPSPQQSTPPGNGIHGQECASYTQNRAAIHLHGGRTPWISDGTPHQWIIPAGEWANTPYKEGVSLENVPDMPNPGPGSTTYYYSNQQSARLMFYHDHAWGITRLNVLVGMAAGYLITDEFEAELVGSGAVPTDQIPLVIQDRTFVDATDVRTNDPTWNYGTGPLDPQDPTIRQPRTGDLWMPHVYVPAQNPYDPTGTNPFGRWVYGPWFFPPTNNIYFNVVPNPYHDPACSDPDPAVYAFCTTPGQPPMVPGTPVPSVGAESFFDTAVVNGQAFPYLDVQPRAYRFRILNAANDRYWNLNLYEADARPGVQSFDGRTHTEVRMVPADGTWDTALFPTWPTDGRVEGVPYPYAQGPSFIQIGTEGGFLPRPVVVPPQPITFVTDPTFFNVGNIDTFGLFLGPAERADVIVDFSKYAGKTLILYNDAPAAVPAFDPRHDFLTGAPDLSDTGGYGRPPPWNPAGAKQGPQIGYGPNTRTIMQIRVANAQPAPAYDLAALEAAFGPNPAQQDKTLFERGQDPIIVGQDAYNGVYKGVTFPAVWPYWGFSRIEDNSLPVFTVGGTYQTFPMEPKGIHDEMGAAFDMEYGRMGGQLGIANPAAGIGLLNFTLYRFTDPATEVVNANMQPLSPVLGDGTQIWKISHNGVDMHPIHFHIFDVQVINRVGWDGQIRPPHPTELGWKDTVRIAPLEDTIVAMRPWAPKVPFGVPDSLRPLNPAIPLNSPYGFTNIDPVTQQAKVPVDVNRVENFGWEYVWHCHILSHEENDMMRAIILNVVSGVPGSPSTLGIDDTGAFPVLSWTDATPVDYVTQSNFGNAANEIAFRIERTADVGGPITTMFALANTTSYTDTTAAPGAYYRYRVVAYNEAGENPSNAVEIRAAAPSTAATGVTLDALPVSGTVQVLPGAPIVFTALGQGGSGAYEYQFSVNGTVQQAYGPAATFSLPATTAAGIYDVRVDVRTSAISVSDTSTTLSYVVAVPPTAGLNLAAAPATTPVLFGTPVVFTAAGTGSSGYQYRFSLSSDNVNFTMSQDWSATATWTLGGTTSPGTYYVKAEVRTNASGVDASQVVSTVIQYRPATTLSLRSSVASPFPLSNPPTTVTFLALGGGSAGTPALGFQYRFSLSTDNVTFTPVQGFSITKLWTLPADTAPGTYYLRAEVTTNPAGGVADKTASMTFTVLPGPDPATGLTLTPSLTSPQYASTAVAFTAAGSGGTPTYYYRFLLSSDGVNFNQVQASSTAGTWTLPDTTAVGIYTVRVEVRTNPFKVLPDLTTDVAYELLPVSPATSLTLTANVASPQFVGSSVFLTASASGGGPAYQYRFWQSTDGGVTFTVLRDWSSLASWTVDTSVGGKYVFMADVRTTTSGGRQLFARLPYTVEYPAATGVTLIPSVTSPALQGASVVLQATGSSTVAGLTYYYKFSRSLDGGATWAVLRDYSAASTLAIDTSIIGTHRYMVDCVTNLGASREATSAISYVVNPPPPTSITLTTNVASPQPVDTVVTFTAIASSGVAGLTFEYRFWLSTDNGVTYTLKQGPTTTNTYTMPTTAPGSYRVLADARTVGTSVFRSVLTTKAFVISP
jgi:FtsP/CotA-like multicopper oxidase with cupredoxin domain